MTIKIPIRVAPFADESFIGFLSRVAERNYVPSIASLCEVLDLPKRGLFTNMFGATEGLTSLSRMLSISEAALAEILPSRVGGDKASFHIAGLEFRQNHFATLYRRISPTALSAACYHRLIWQLNCLPFCCDTWELLTCRCLAPGCGAKLGLWTASAIQVCEVCGFDQRRGSTQKIKDGDRRSLQMLADLVSSNPLENRRALLQLHPQLQNLNRGVLVQLAYTFGRANAAIQGLGDTRRERNDVTYPHLQILGVEMLKAYPKSLMQLADNQYSTAGPRVFGYLNIAGKGTSPAARQILKELPHTLGAHSHLSLKTLSTVRGRLDKLTLREVAKTLKVDNAAVARIREIGGVEPSPVKKGARRIDWYNHVEVANLAQSMNDRISPDTVHGYYMLPATAVEQCVQAGLLRWHPSLAVQSAYDKRYLVKTEFEAFRQKLENCVVHVGNPKGGRVTISDCFSLVGPHVKPWAPILDLALRGALPGGLGVIDKRRGLRASNLTVDASLALAILLGRAPWQPLDEPDRDYCIGLEVEERLACNPHDVSLLVRSGFLQRVVPNKPKFTRASVLNVAKDFISSREIGARLGVDPACVAGWANRRKLEHPRGIRLYLRSDLNFYLPPNFYGRFGSKERTAKAAQKKDSDDLSRLWELLPSFTGENVAAA